jgi:dienelactone hydrolase
MATFVSDGKQIRLDQYPPNQAGSAPAVILIHGSGGPLHGLDPFASQAAQFGVYVFVLHPIPQNLSPKSCINGPNTMGLLARTAQFRLPCI